MIQFTTAEPTTPAPILAVPKPGAYTVLRAQGIATKRFNWTADRELVIQPAPNLARGSYYVEAATSVDQLRDRIQRLSTNEVLVWGVPAYAKGDFRTRSDLSRLNGSRSPATIARTREHFAWSASAGWLMVDFDHLSPDTSLESLRKLLISAAPGLEMLPMLAMSSASANIYVKGNNRPLRGLTGARAYLPVADARRIPELGSRLVERLLLAGNGRAEVSKTGQILIRTPIDSGVWQPERVDYAAGAYLDPPLEQRRDLKMWNHESGLSLEDGVLPPLGPEDQARRSSTTAALRHAVREKATEVRAAYRAERARAGHAVAWRDDGDRQVLEGEHEILLSGGHTITVDEILANSTAYHGRTCADPVEPNYGDDDRIAVIKTDGVPNIFSHAHGGQLFYLEQSAQEAFTAEWVINPSNIQAVTLPTEGERIAAILGDAMPSLYREVTTLHGSELLSRRDTLEAATLAADPLGDFFHSAVLPLADRFRAREHHQFMPLLCCNLKGDRSWAGYSRQEQDLLLEAAWAFVAPPLALMRRSPLVPEVDLLAEPTPRAWLVDGLVPAASIGVVFGASKSRKTFVVNHLAGCVGAGLQFRNRTVHRGGILYFASESVPQISERVRAWAGAHRDCRPNYKLVPKALPLLDPPASLREVLQRHRFPSGDPLRLVVIDVLRASITDQNDGEVMGQAVATAQLIERAFGVCVIIVHHSPRADSTRIGGSNALDGGVDWAWSVVKKREISEVAVHFSRDGNEDEKWSVKVENGVLREVDASEGDWSEAFTEKAACELVGRVIRRTGSLTRTEFTASVIATCPQWFEPNRTGANTAKSRRNNAIRDAIVAGFIEETKNRRLTPGPNEPPPEAPASLEGL